MGALDYVSRLFDFSSGRGRRKYNKHRKQLQVSKTYLSFFILDFLQNNFYSARCYFPTFYRFMWWVFCKLWFFSPG